jgi:nucleotide-binding universal stress UspA family protein
MASNIKKILLATDGSAQTFQAATYVSLILSGTEAEVTLFHTRTKVPEAFWEQEKDPLWLQANEALRNWELQQERKIRDYMKKTRDIFLAAGFPEERVKISVQTSQQGIARDILAESRNHYDAVVIGRRGLSTLSDLHLGSIANKIVAKLTGVTAWLIGGTPGPEKFLVALDTSDAAMRTTDYVARVLGGSNHKVLLFHVLTPLDTSPQEAPESLPEAYRVRFLKEAEDKIRSVFAAAAQRLADAGLDAGNITSRIVTGAASRAGAIVDEARRTGFETVVLGRKGVTAGDEQDIGRVGYKVTQLAEDLAVWIVA